MHNAEDVDVENNMSVVIIEVYKKYRHRFVFSLDECINEIEKINCGRFVKK